MPIKKREISKKLETKFGFKKLRSRHEKYSFYLDGKKVATTVMSHSHREVTDILLKQMAKQIGVYKKRFFEEMIECTKSRDDYINEISNNGWLDQYN